jgi:mannitol-1-phosphate 5-dehydrogenase
LAPRALFYGAGAIGRGYVAPLLFDQGYEIHFVDTNRALIERLRSAGRYTSLETGSDEYARRTVEVSGAYLPGEENAILSKAEIVIIAVGARNCVNLWPNVARTTGCVLSCENDRESANRLRRLSGMSNAYFAVPDVITSNSAPEAELRRDPLAVVTETGTMVVEDNPFPLPASFQKLSPHDLDVQWSCKFYLHNTPHAVTAYLGAERGYTYVHEAMADPDVDRVVVGVLDELSEAIVAAGMAPAAMAEWYSAKELRRFRNAMLFDPISRVAREPFRKLGATERLLGAAQLCLSRGVFPKHLVRGIVSALRYDNVDDPDQNLMTLRSALSTEDLLSIATGLGEHEALFKVLAQALHASAA